ncbi:MAG: alanine--tRNA ligase [Opitutaceae bacterium]|jgi:alanyl-tRNA synthetase
MTSAEIRQSFLDFFASQGHTIVPSSSLLPDSPGLLFTNAGMNQFVPIFLGDKAADVSTWAGARPAKDTRAADTQKCIRAGGKHNDLEDVGYDTYHHTLFEMLGNWSFGDYFKKESLTWGWHLLTKVWGIPAKRLYATVYAPKPGDPSEFDTEANAIWTELFTAAGLDPALHIVHGNRKDNFWQMGDTGPCGPCSEIHFNLLPSDDEVEGRKGVNSSSPRCIEIWNHVFIQFNANADGTFSPLAAKHVDTGMGFERVAGIHATTKGFTDFSPEPSNYNADVFAPLFAKVTALSGKTYTGTVPTKREGLSEQENIDIAFRVLADHARTISCSIADGIMPGNEGRNYVIRRILRRGILYGTKLGLKTGFFEQLVAPVVESLGKVFPELVERQDIIRRVIKSEEESFGRTLDKGLAIFVSETQNPESLKERLLTRRTMFTPEGGSVINGKKITSEGIDVLVRVQPTEIEQTFHVVIEYSELDRKDVKNFARDITRHIQIHRESLTKSVSGALAFQLYDTYGFPLDMTQLLATERGLTVDTAEFERLMDEQRKRGQASTKKTIVVAATEGSDTTEVTPTVFVGYEKLTAETTLVDIVKTEKDTYLVFAETPFYAEMGGQLGDTGDALVSGHLVHITDTVKDKSGRYLHRIASECRSELARDVRATLSVNATRRRAINRHHTATHLLHWALRKVLGTHVRQAGSLNAPDRLRFDFAHFEAVTPAQLREIEGLVNERVLENAAVASYETEFDKKPEGTLAFFGEKYGKTVRVVDTGGYSRELCGGTHVSTTGEIGLVKIISEGAVAAGTRRLEAVAGQAAYDHVSSIEHQLAVTAAKIGVPVSQLDLKLDSLLAHKAEAEKKLKVFEQRAISALANDLAFKAVTKDGLPHVSAVVTVEAPEALREIGSQVLARLGGEGVVVIGAAFGPDKLSLVAFCSPAAIKAGHQAGKIIAAITPKLGGKGGGKPDFAMGGGKDVAKLAEVLG